MSEPTIESGSAPPAPSDQPSPSSQAGQPPSDQPEHPGQRRLGKALSFARRHPAVSVISAAGLGLLAGAELALGVVLGAGFGMLMKKQDGARRSSEQGVKKVEGGVEKIGEEVEEAAAGATEAAHTVRRRARQLIDTAPGTVKRRARAVVQAARGQISPVPPAGGPPPKQPASEAAETSAG